MWDPYGEAWNEGYERLKAFKERAGYCRVPAGFKDEEGHNLGSWVGTQRRRLAALTPKRIALLDELGFVCKAR